MLPLRQRFWLRSVLPLTLASSCVAVGISTALADTQTPSSPTPISLTTIGSAYTQNFDSLAGTGTSSTVPTGWVFLESGSGATRRTQRAPAATGRSGTGTGWESGDFDYDGSTDAAIDYDLWLSGRNASQGDPLGGNGNVQPVPEPGTMVLMAFALAGLPVMARRPSRRTSHI